MPTAQSPFSQHSELVNLKDIHLPEPISLWPITLGWWILGVISLVIMYLSLRWFIKKWVRQTYKREALRQLSHLEIKYMTNANQHQLLDELSELMRRICLTIFPRHQVAGLTGSQWLAFLDNHGGTDQFSNGSGVALVEQKFCRNINPDINRDKSHQNTYDAADLILICGEWIRTQK